jgi:acetyltransferase-like isoleucine patch superfamily enzyme
LLPAAARTELSREFFVGVSSLQSREKKRQLYEYGIKCGLVPLGIVHPRTVISRDAILGAGHTVLAGAIIGPYTQLQENVTVNMGAMIESRCLIRPHVQLAASCWIGSGVTIGEGSYIGSFACVQPNVRIGENVVIGSGAIVTEDVPDGAVITGQYKSHEEQPGRKSKLGRAAADKEGAKLAVA